MSVARVTEIISSSTESFEDAVRQGVKRASKTLKNVRGGDSNRSLLPCRTLWFVSDATAPIGSKG